MYTQENIDHTPAESEAPPSRPESPEIDDKGLTAILEDALSKHQEIPFMAVDVEESTEFINSQAWYILRLYGPLINGQKAVVSITGIQVFFDILMPEDLSSDLFETKIRDILSGITKWFRVEHVAREYGIQLSGWSMLRNYKYLPGGNLDSLCAHAFHISIENFYSIEDDIETYSSRGIGELPVAQYDEDRVFMICMTLYWKDDPRSLKQICIVDVESAPEPRLITIIYGSQTNLLKAFALCWRAFAPDIQLGFNDSQYDWPFIMEKANKLHLIEWI
ncbi:ribonuclease H-like domain-containing protein [Gigaspora rosea]|uniref:Ribonuclease H-like domain-containing protein n=1 Tax=Gigaspora rosea TaxID=44941 RepID=A0A397UFA0_9GLOM|nr:ribonuclease H-like domain-containing protein [Gigaspora rosea]